MNEKRGVSPVITTLILILVAIILAIIVLLWARSWIAEKTLKFDEPIERSCDRLNYQVSLKGNNVSITNLGDVPIYRIGLRQAGGFERTITYSDPIKLSQGLSKIVEFKGLKGSSWELIPVLLGKTEKSDVLKEYSCNTYLKTLQ